MSRKAFSLIELMAVVAIIGVLVTIVMPRFYTFVAKARMAEAKGNLGIIKKLQKSFYLAGPDTDVGRGAHTYHGGLDYGAGQATAKCGSATTEAKNDLGFRLEDCGATRYTYGTTGGTAPTGTDTAQRGTGAVNRLFIGCTADEDAWTMSREGELKHTTNVLEECD